ncbi:MAG: outer membrane protein transport protein [Prevotella sp.]|nr:outer membrane protein transport protein [Prevotella sp.]
MKKSVFSLITIITLLLTFPVASLYAQGDTSSPYSQYGVGLLSDQSIGMSRGMNGVGIGLKEQGQVNYLNPATYSQIDSTTFIFDAAMTLQTANFRETTAQGTRSLNARDASFEYAVASFRVRKHLGMSFGILPYSVVGYDYSTKPKIINNYVQYPVTETKTSVSTQNTGSGGLRMVYLGAGWAITDKLSIGTNVNYMWGTLDNLLVTTYTDSYVKSLSRYYTATISTVKLDFGVNYSLSLDKKNVLTMGLTFSPGYRMGASPRCEVITSNSQSAVNDTTLYKAQDALRLPTTIGAGVSWKHNNKWIVGLDYTYQGWSKMNAVDYISEKTGKNMGDDTDGFNDRHKINVGAQYCKNANGRSFKDRIRFRFGAGYTTSYLLINDQKGPREISLSAGVGLPIINVYNTRSMLNVSFQWVNTNATGMIRDNTFRINLGLTFNERWFAKWKFE